MDSSSSVWWYGCKEGFSYRGTSRLNLVRRNARAVAHAKNVYQQEQDGIRSDVFKTFSPFSNAGTMAKALFFGLAVPVGLFFAITSAQKSQDKEWYPKRDAKYL